MNKFIMMILVGVLLQNSSGQSVQAVGNGFWCCCSNEDDVVSGARFSEPFTNEDDSSYNSQEAAYSPQETGDDEELEDVAIAVFSSFSPGILRELYLKTKSTEYYFSGEVERVLRAQAMLSHDGNLLPRWERAFVTLVHPNSHNQELRDLNNYISEEFQGVYIAYVFHVLQVILDLNMSLCQCDPYNLMREYRVGGIDIPAGLDRSQAESLLLADIAEEYEILQAASKFIKNKRLIVDELSPRMPNEPYFVIAKRSVNPFDVTRRMSESL